MLNIPNVVQKRILSVLSKESTVKQAIVFGSRARGDARPNSDIDLALVGCNIPLSLFTKLREAAGLYSLDIVRIEGLDNDELRSSIERDGVTIYGREETAARI